MVQPSHPSMSDYWIGPSEAMQPILERLLDIARANAPVRITGEFGTGRTALAHLIHHSGPRVHGPFLLSLFDRSPWARRRTFSPPPSKPWFASQELAAPCTVYLQHIERLGPDEQEILEDVLDHKEVQTGPTPGDRVESKARVISAARSDSMIDGRVKGLGPDLSSRLGAISIRVPALRERMGDFPALTAHFVNEWNRNHRKAVQLDSPVVELLAGYSWPGNLHQLQGVIATLLWRTKRTRLTLDDLEPGIAIWRDRRSSRALDEELYGRAGEALGTYLRDHL